MQDDKGFLWFATDNGISCYDGSTFKNYNAKHGLWHNTVISISESETGEKWVTTNGAGLFVLKNGSFQSHFQKELQENHLYFVQFDHQRIWCTDNGGNLYLITPKDKDTTIRKIDSRKKFISFYKTLTGELFVTGYSGLHIINDTNIQVYLPHLITEKTCGIAYNSADRSLIVALKNEILFIKSDSIVKRISIPNPYEISDIILDNIGRLWVSGPGKVFLFDNNTTIDLTFQLQLEKTLITDLFEDKDGNIWIGTYGRGVLCISTLKILNYKTSQEALTNNVISLVSVGDRIYFGSFGAVACIKNQALQRLPFKHISPTDYLYFIKNIDSSLFIGTPWGLLRKNLKNGEEKRLLDSGVISLCKNIDGSIWIGRYNSCGTLSKRNDYSAKTVLPLFRYNAIAHDKSGVLYFGTDSGLVILKDKASFKITVSDTPLANWINYIANDSKDRIWLATNSGVYLLDKARNITIAVFEHILKNIKCTSIQEDCFGNIWVGTFNGIYKITSNRIHSYTTASGLTSNEVLSLTIDSKNQLWVGTVDGISCIAISEAWPNKPISAFYITQVTAGRTKIFHFPKALDLSYDDASIKISFVAIDFPVADKIEYQYIIENLVDDWQQTLSTSLELPSLPAGSYIFKIKARKNNGEWSKVISFPIRIRPPFWQVWWFKLGLGIVIMLILGGFILRYIRYRENKHKEKASVQSQMIILKQQALRAMINPHFVFNCLNNILGYIQKNERDIAKSYLLQFSRFFRMTLEHSKHEHVKLNEELERLELYLRMEQLRFGEKMQFNIINTIDLQKDIWIPNMVIQPFIENAILHGVTHSEITGTINIHFHLKNHKYISITITDDGPGFGNQTKIIQDKKDRTSLGIALSTERLRLLETLTSLEHCINFSNLADNSGACVEIIIPLLFAKPQFTKEKFLDNS